MSRRGAGSTEHELAMDREVGVSHVAIELAAIGENRTEVVVTHSADPSTTDRDEHLQGWRDCLGRLLETYGTACS